MICSRTLHFVLSALLSICSLSAAHFQPSPAAVAALSAQPKLLATLDAILHSDDFTRATATVSMFEAPHGRELMAKLKSNGSCNPHQETAKWIGGHTWDGIKIASGAFFVLLFGSTLYDNANSLDDLINIITFQDDDSFCLYAVIALATVLITEGTHTLVTTYKKDSRLHAIMHDVALFHTKTQELAAILAQHPELQTGLPETAALANPINMDSENAQALAALLQTRTLQDEPSALSLRGRVRAAYALMLQTPQACAASLHAVNALAAAVSLAKPAQN